MNRVLLSFIIVFYGMWLNAQQVPFYNHVVINPFVYNPAMAGASGDVNAYLVRNQRYASFSTASVNNYLTIDGAFAKQKAGFGVQVSNQTAGLQQQFAASLSYAYRIRLTKTQELRFGLNAGILDNRFDVKSINVEQLDDPYLVSMRPAVTSFDMNAGVAYSWNSLKIGLAVPQMIGNKVAFDKENSRGYYRLARHVLFSTSYDFPLTKSGMLSLKPVGFLRYVPGAPIQYDVLLQFDHRKIGWASAGYKSGYSVQMNVGFHVLKQFKIGYSYEYLVGSIKNYSSGAHHELMLGFKFGNPKRENIPVPDKSVAVTQPDTINQQLIERNKELEELLLKTLAEKEIIKEQQNELIQQNKELQQEKEVLIVEVEKQKTPSTDTVATVPQKDPQKDPPVKPLEKIPYAKGYRFIDLDLADSPDGFYVISGVFSSRKNADIALTKSLEDFSSSYLVINKKNGFYYVVILYTLDQEEATKMSKKYKRSTKKDAWILNYHIEN